MSTPRHEVLLTAGAERDLHELHDYIARFDSAAAADALLDKLGDAIENLALFPERGAFPKELIALGIREYRQVTFKPYRLIYRVRDRKVYVYLIVDGRRDMQALLARRLLGA